MNKNLFQYIMVINDIHLLLLLSGKSYNHIYLPSSV